MVTGPYINKFINWQFNKTVDNNLIAAKAMTAEAVTERKLQDTVIKSTSFNQINELRFNDTTFEHL